MKIDAHQHFWKFDALRDAWITDDMSVIQRDFLPEDLKPVLEQNKIDACVAVQASQSDTETEFLLELARKNSFIKGVVGWVDLKSDDLELKLERYSSEKLIKGFRHVLQAEPDEAYMLQSSFQKGIKVLGDYGYTYDILIYPNHLKNAMKLVQNFENQPFILDHIAKPYIKNGLIEKWARDIKDLAQMENLSCKVSGIITEADWGKWTYEEIVPYLDVIFEAFGTERLMFGSDWPVCLIAGEYKKVIGVLERYLTNFSKEEVSMLMGETAKGIYKID